jgi:signal transduction histidine kinase
VLESPDAQVLADAGELFVLLKNLIENAVDHSPQGGIVRITLTPSGICVEDQGKGVAEDQRTQVFERFWRAPDNTKPGSGLGLAICMEVARAHGWRLECRPSALGGALFQLYF